jgi:hypothetical protein
VIIVWRVGETDAGQSQKASPQGSAIILAAGGDGNEPSSRERLRGKRVGRTRRSEKRVEIHEMVIIRTASGSLPALCAACSTGNAILLAPEQAAALTDVPPRMIYRWVEAGTIHYREEPNGKLTVCVKTLLAAGKEVRKPHPESIYQTEGRFSPTEDDEKENKSHD